MSGGVIRLVDTVNSHSESLVEMTDALTRIVEALRLQGEAIEALQAQLTVLGSTSQMQSKLLGMVADHLMQAMDEED